MVYVDRINNRFNLAGKGIFCHINKGGYPFGVIVHAELVVQRKRTLALAKGLNEIFAVEKVGKFRIVRVDAVTGGAFKKSLRSAVFLQTHN